MGRRRLERHSGRHALVDGIRFHLPVNSEQTPALMAAFSINAERAAELLPGNEVHPFRLWSRGILLITVVDYRVTDIGKYIEFSIAIVCTHGRRPAPRLIPAVFRKWFGTGQYVLDLPVSTEISVKGGKGIWGMPKHQANLDFKISDDVVSSQYDKDGKLAMKIEIDRPGKAWLPVRLAAANYCQFRGMLVKSYINFKGKLGFKLMKKGSARLTLGSHPLMDDLRTLEIDPNPLSIGFLPETEGLLDDYFESWFLTFAEPPERAPAGLETVIDLGHGEEWLPGPVATE